MNRDKNCTEIYPDLFSRIKKIVESPYTKEAFDYLYTGIVPRNPVIINYDAYREYNARCELLALDVRYIMKHFPAVMDNIAGLKENLTIVAREAEIKVTNFDVTTDEGTLRQPYRKLTVALGKKPEDVVNFVAAVRNVITIRMRTDSRNLAQLLSMPPLPKFPLPLRPYIFRCGLNIAGQ